MQRKICCTLLLFVSAYAHAELRPFATLDLGLSQAYVGQEINVNLAPAYQVENTYAPGSQFSTRMLVGGMFGVEGGLSKDWAFQVGLDYDQSQPYEVSGWVNQFMDPTFNSLQYQYQIFSRRILAESKLLYTFYDRYHPYVMAGAGVAFNRAYAYEETASPGDTFSQPMQPFAANTDKSFAYTMGVGMDVDMTKRLRLGAGYRYINLGKASLGLSPDQISSDTLSNNHLYANEAVVQLSYFFK